MSPPIAYYNSIFVCIFFLMLYGHFRCKRPNFSDPLEKKFLGLFDGWQASHFVFYLFLGFYFPGFFVQSMALGATWEVFEHVAGKSGVGVQLGDNKFGCTAKSRRSTSENNIKEPWFYGKSSDVAINALGYLIGEKMRREI